MNENCNRRRHRLTLTIHSSRKNIILSLFLAKEKQTNSLNKEIKVFISIADVLFKSDNEEEFGISRFSEHD